MDRKHERAQLITEIILECSAGRRTSRISDMSMGGCYIESITNFRKGEPVLFDIKNSAGDILRFTGDVAYVLDGFGFGVTFTNMSTQHIEFLKTSLPKSSRNLPEQAENILEI